MDWLRLWNCIQDDPKVMSLEHSSAWFWVQCLICASKNDPRGILPRIEEIAFQAHWPLEDARARFDCLLANNLIVKDSDGSYTLYKWAYYQPRSDDSAARQRKSRSKAKRDTSQVADVTVTGLSRDTSQVEDVTSVTEQLSTIRDVSRDNHVSVARPSHSRRDKNRTEEKRDSYHSSLGGAGDETKDSTDPRPEEQDDPNPPPADRRTPEQIALCEPGPETPADDETEGPADPPLEGKCTHAQIEHLRRVVKDTGRGEEWDISVQAWAFTYEHRDIVDAVLHTPKTAPPSYGAKALRSIAEERLQTEKDRSASPSTKADKKREPTPAYLETVILTPEQRAVMAHRAQVHAEQMAARRAANAAAKRQGVQP